jgi:hypothetical protein
MGAAETHVSMRQAGIFISDAIWAEAEFPLLTDLNSLPGKRLLWTTPEEKFRCTSGGIHIRAREPCC